MKIGWACGIQRWRFLDISAQIGLESSSRAALTGNTVVITWIKAP